MADSRLQWRQLTQAQPNVAPLLAQAGRGFNDAAEAASNILGNYQTGQEAAGDQELARLLASATNQEELNTLVNSDEVRGLRLSENGINMLNQAQGNRVDWENTRSVISDRQGRLGIAQADLGIRQAAEGRRVTLFADDQERQEWLRDNSGSFLNSERSALTNGTKFSAAIDQFESGGNPDQYDTLYGHRNRTNGVRVSQMTIGQASSYAAPDGNYGQSVNSEIGRVATPMGKFQIVGSTLRKVQKDLQLPDNLPFSPAVQEQLGLYLAQQRVNGPRTREAMREGLRSEWAGFKDLSESQLDTIIDEVRSMPAITRDSILSIGFNPSGTLQRGFGGDTFANDMASSGLFTPSQILEVVDPLRNAGSLRDAEIKRQDQEVLNEAFATANQTLLDNPDINTVEQLRDAVFSDERFTATENEARYSNLRGLIGEDPGRLRPSVEEDPTTVASAVGAVEAASNAVESNPRYSIFADANRLAASDTATVGQNVAERLGLDSDGENPRGILGFGEKGFDVNKLDRMIEDAARRNDVRPEVAAAAFVRAFERDPIGRNTLANRFDVDTVDDLIQGIDQRDERDFREATRSVKVMEAEMNQLRTQEQLLRAQLIQYPEGSPNRAAIQVQIDNLQAQLADVERRYSSAPSRN